MVPRLIILVLRLNDKGLLSPLSNIVSASTEYGAASPRFGFKRNGE